MEFNRFKRTITNNRKFETSVKEALNEFNNRVQWSGDIPKIMKEIGKKLDVLIFEIPMKDSEFGAVYLDTTYSKYLLLNSNQPRSKMYFSFCHDLYHIIKGTPDYINERREVYFNHEYTGDENECKANLFAANLLMPEYEFKKMYELYNNDSEDTLYTIIKLMNYFNSPYVAVLLRLFELNIFGNDDLKGLNNFLELEMNDVEKLFDELWIDKEILTPTLKDEMGHIFNIIKKEGEYLLKKQLISEYDFKNIQKNIELFYNEIKLEGKDE
ncbi:ImmA/IrrE family metallo-endopeptidase [Clostridium sp. MSJ-11]|uniref:ImmA/IrrE family metallo-endopeptidase n=1 Tax=Clostridium mobile TaxID=2841512 RepID=A0ABS6EKK9_9CLOT|nr:ImmA/IrrE family metallo-endopeptidase [Clostridium mobile]MBU5485744.1 ImmA/IrrE family metallo-endopeptidase [Clostridium mobile]